MERNVCYNERIHLIEWEALHMLGSRIRQLRIKKNLTLSQLAERASISKSYLSYIERGVQKNPSIQILEKIAIILSVDVNKLLHGNSNKDDTKQIKNEWIDLVTEVEKTKISRAEIQELKLYFEYLKWRSKTKD